MENLIIEFKYNQKCNVFDINEYLTKLFEIKKINYFYSKNIKVTKNKKTEICSVISIYENIKSINFDNLSFNVECELLFENFIDDIKIDKKKSIFKEDMIDNYFNIFKTFELNDDFGIYDTLFYKDLSIDFFSCDQEKIKKIEISGLIEENNLKLKDISKLLEYTPKKIINLTSFDFFEKYYDDNIIRFKFLNCDKNLKNYDVDFYDDIKIRFNTNDIINYENLIICKTISNNCVIFNRNNKK